MNRMRIGLVVWFCFIALAIVFAAAGFNSLTDTIGTRFDLQGKPLETGSKISLALPLGVLFIALEALMLGLFIGIEKIPVGMINVSDRDYWLASPERRKLLYAKIRTMLIALGILITIISIGILNLIFRSNASPISANVDSTTTLIATAIAVAAFIFWSLRLMRKPQTN